MAHRVILGAPGSGKSEALKLWTLRRALERVCAILLFDWHGSLSKSLLGHLCAAGLERRVLYEEAKWTDRVLGWPFTVPATDADPERKKTADLLLREWWLQPTYAMAGMKDARDKPWTQQYLDAAAGICFSQPAVRRIDDVLAIFRHDDPIGIEMIRAAGDAAAAWNFIDLDARSQGRMSHQWATECYAAMRKLKYVGLPPVYLRDHPQGMDHRELFSRKAIILRNLSGIPFEAAQALVIMETGKAIRTAQERYEATGRPTPLLIITDEAGALGVASTPLLLGFMQEARKWMEPGGLWFASQSIDDFSDRERFGKLLGYADEHYYGKMMAGLDEVADDLATPCFDPRKVLYTRERMVHDGYLERPTEGRGKSIDHLGNERENVHEGVSFVSRYKTVTDEYYQDPSSQRAEFKRDVAKLGPGQFFVRDRQGVRLITEPLLPPPFPLGLSATRTEKAIARIKATYPPPYRWETQSSSDAGESPPTGEPSTPSATPPPQAPPGSSNPPRRRGAASRLDESGTAGS